MELKSLKQLYFLGRKVLFFLFFLQKSWGLLNLITQVVISYFKQYQDILPLNRAVSPHSSHLLSCLLTYICSSAHMTRPCQQKHWSQCKQRSNKQPRVRRWVRYQYHVSRGQPTITLALSQHKIGALGCIMKGSFLKIDLWLSSFQILQAFIHFCSQFFILSKKKKGGGTGHDTFLILQYFILFK